MKSIKLVTMSLICKNPCSTEEMVQGECLCYNMSLMDKLGTNQPKEYRCIQCNQLYPKDELISLDDGSVICLNCNENGNYKSRKKQF